MSSLKSLPEGFNWGGNDVSQIMHQFENEIAGSPGYEYSPQISRFMHEPSGKRSRLSESEMSPSIQGDLSIVESVSSPISIGDTLEIVKLRTKVEELQLKNKALSDKIRSDKNENDRNYDECTRRLEYETNRANTFKKRCDDYEKKYYDAKANWQTKIRTLESALKSSKSNTVVLPTTVANKVTTVSNSKDTQYKAELEELGDLVQSKSRECKNLQTTLIGAEKKIRELEQLLIAAKVDEGKIEEASEARDLRRQLSKEQAEHRMKIKKYQALEEKIENQLQLQQENDALKVKLQLADCNQTDNISAMADYLKLRDERQEWVMKFKQIFKDYQSERNEDVTALMLDDRPIANDAQITPLLVMQILVNTQKQCLVHIADKGIQERKVAELLRGLDQSRRDLNEAEVEKNLVSQQLEKVQLELKFLKSKARLFDGEVKNLRAMQQSQLDEMYIGVAPNERQMNHRKALETTIRQLRAERDQMISDYNNEMKNAEKELQQAISTRVATESRLKREVEGHGRTKSEVQALQVQLANEKEEIRNLQKRYEQEQQCEPMALEVEGNKDNMISELQNSLIQLQRSYEELQRTSGQDFLPSNTKVLHMPDNPFSVARSNFTSQKQVNSAEQEVVEPESCQMNEDVGGAVDRSISSVNFQGSNNLSTSFAANNNAVDSNKLNDRLKQMFKERMQTYREAVYLITGYKVDILPDISDTLRIKLRSVFAESSQDEIILRKLQDGNFEVESNDYVTQRVDPSLLELLRKPSGLTCFVSQLTLDLFEKQTMQ